MHGRIRPARYAHPVVRTHLAGQYVLGTLSRRTRQRLEALLAEDVAWQALVRQWHDRLASTLPVSAVRPPRRVWRNIEAALGRPSRRWAGWCWRGAGRRWLPLSLASAAGVMLLVNVMRMPAPAPLPPRYLAVMTTAGGSEDALVLMAYQGDKPGQSRLQVSWSSRTPSPADRDAASALLWMRDKTTGRVMLLGRLAALQAPTFLTPGEWQALKNSDEVFVTRQGQPDGRVLFKGRCIELAS